MRLSIVSIYLVIPILLSCQEMNYKNNDFMITNTVVKHLDDLQLTVWEITVKGEAGETQPQKAGQLDGAPCFGIRISHELKISRRRI